MEKKYWRAFVFKKLDMQNYGVLLLPYGKVMECKTKEEAERCSNFATNCLKRLYDIHNLSDNEIIC